MIKMYRAVPVDKFIPGKVYNRENTKRIPSNIPYMVDNIWEYLRPNHMPSRRHAAYASPTIELALANASASTDNGYIVKEVKFSDNNFKIIQLSVTDARYHSDVRAIKDCVFAKLGKNFSELSLAHKNTHSALFMPAVDKKDLENYFNSHNYHKILRQELEVISQLWKEAFTPNVQSNGELFFELLDDCSYTLEDIQ